MQGGCGVEGSIDPATEQYLRPQTSFAVVHCEVTTGSRPDMEISGCLVYLLFLGSILC